MNYGDSYSNDKSQQSAIDSLLQWSFRIAQKATGVSVKSVVCLVGTIHMILFTDELGETLVRH